MSNVLDEEMLVDLKLVTSLLLLQCNIYIQMPYIYIIFNESHHLTGARLH